MFKTEGFFISLIVMAGVTYLIRLLPILFVRKRISNTFVRSFLHYVPYAVLATIAFPAIIFSTGNVISGAVATVTCVLLAYLGRGIITVSLGGITSALIVEIILHFVA